MSGQETRLLIRFQYARSSLWLSVFRLAGLNGWRSAPGRPTVEA